MPKARTLSGIFSSAIKSSATAYSSARTVTGGDKTLQKYVTSLEASSPLSSQFITKRLTKSSKNLRSPSRKAPPVSLPVRKLEDSVTDSQDTNNLLGEELSSLFSVTPSGSSLDSQKTNGKESAGPQLDVPWFENLGKIVSLHRKEVSRTRKQKYIHKYTQVNRFDRLVSMCAQKFGTNTVMHIFGKLGHENGVKEYNALIKICIEEAKKSDDEDIGLEQMCRAFQLIKSMKEQGFRLEEETYGPVLIYLTDLGEEQEFDFFCDLIKDGNPSSLARLGYYEMLLYIRVNNEEKIQELCNNISTNAGAENINLGENYLLALCESDRKNDLLRLLEIIDITNISSVDHVSSIFKSMGRLSLDSLAEKLILAFRRSDYGAENISTLIFSYATSIPNLEVEDIIVKFRELHGRLEMTPSSVSYEKLILYSCDLLKVHVALDILDQMCEVGLTLSIDTLHSILHACEESFEFNLVRKIYSLIFSHDLKPNSETFRMMIHMSVKMKDFEGAYGMLSDLKKLNLTPTASMYNAIMGGYFREKNVNGALMVVKQMELADVKPDAQTYSYLIGNCDSEEKIIKYYEELTLEGIQPSKLIFMALINAYATCGQFEKAKQVLLDKRIPVKNLNEIKNVLISALASHGQMSDALNIYEEIKEARCNVEPKTAICLIEHLQSDKGELGRLLELLQELKDLNYWSDGCRRVAIYCIRHKYLSSAVSLLKQLNDRFCNNEENMEVIFDEVFSIIAETEPIDLKIGWDLLNFIKDELGLTLSRKSLDFLLGACVKAKDLANSLLIWKEYEAAGLVYNVMSYLRMYQALLASGGHATAKAILMKIPRDDTDVRTIIQTCQDTYIQATTKKKKKKKRKEKIKDE